MENQFFITGIDRAAFKILLSEALRDVLQEHKDSAGSIVQEIIGTKEAAAFLKIKMATLYKKTSDRDIPHTKKGNKLYFCPTELKQWLLKGRVQTADELRNEAMTYTVRNAKQVKTAARKTER